MIGDVLKKNFSEAVREKNLKVAGYPRFEPKDIAENASQVEFSATFEVYPDVVLGALDTSRVERPSVNVTQSDVDKTLDTLRKQRMQYELAGRPAAKGDRLNIDFRGTIDGEEFAGSKAENSSLILGEADFSRTSRNRLPI